MATRVGFIGLGQQGRPMAINLSEDGFDLMVHDVRAELVAELVTMGAKGARSPAKVGAQAELVAVIVLNILGAAEGMALVAALGIEPRVLQGAIRTCRAQSLIADNWADYRPGSHGAVVFHKDLTIALEAADELGLSMPGAALVRDLIPRLMG